MVPVGQEHNLSTAVAHASIAVLSISASRFLSSPTIQLQAVHFACIWYVGFRVVTGVKTIYSLVRAASCCSTDDDVSELRECLQDSQHRWLLQAPQQTAQCDPQRDARLHIPAGGGSAQLERICACSWGAFNTSGMIRAHHIQAKCVISVMFAWCCWHPWAGICQWKGVLMLA